MSEVKTERMPLRQRQAQETRRLIAHAARELFSRGGYAATSLEAVAEEAGVAARTVYSAFGTKKAILGAICDEWLAEAGVRETVSVGFAERDLGRRLALVARASRRQWELERGMRAMLEGAAAADAEVARMLAGWKEDRARSLRSVFEGVDAQLRSGMKVDRAGAILRALSSGEVYAELVAGEGWSPADYEEWLTALLMETLVKRKRT